MKFWEDAVKGSSALQAGLRRRLLDEVTVALGQDTAAIYWDIEKIDSIMHVTSFCILDLGFSPKVLVKILQNCFRNGVQDACRTHFR